MAPASILVSYDKYQGGVAHICRVMSPLIVSEYSSSAIEGAHIVGVTPP